MKSRNVGRLLASGPWAHRHVGRGRSQQRVDAVALEGIGEVPGERRPRLLDGGLVCGGGVHHAVGRRQLAGNDEAIVRALDVLARDRLGDLLHGLARLVLREVGLEIVVGFVERHREAGRVVELLQLRHLHLDDRGPGRAQLGDRRLGDGQRVGIEILEEVRAIDAELHAAEGCRASALARR